MSQILVGYATQYGSTQKVARAVAATLRETWPVVDVRPVEEVCALDGYAAVVLGAPLIMFRWHKQAHRFLKRHRKALLERPVAVFALGPVHDPHDEAEWRSSKEQLDKELAKHAWLKPAALGLFGGRYNPEALRPPIKWLAGSAPATDIRDWDAIHAWAAGLSAVFVQAFPQAAG